MTQPKNRKMLAHEQGRRSSKFRLLRRRFWLLLVAFALMVVLVVSSLSGCSTHGTRPIVVDRWLLEDVRDPSILKPGDDPVENHIETMGLFHTIRAKWRALRDIQLAREGRDRESGKGKKN